MAATDHPLKRLVALAPEDFAAWLLGEPVRSATLRQSELTAEPIDADLAMDVTQADGQELIFHLEFQGPRTHRPCTCACWTIRPVLHSRCESFQSSVWSSIWAERV